MNSSEDRSLSTPERPIQAPVTVVHASTEVVQRPKHHLPVYATVVKESIGLTPILEDFDDLQLSSTKKHSNDDL